MSSRHNHNKHKKRSGLLMAIGIAVGTVAFIAGLVYLGAVNKSTPSVAASGKSSLTVSTVSYDFGTVSMATGKVSTTFNVSNATDQPVVISRFFSSCMCTSVSARIGDRNYGPFGMQGHGGAIPFINATVPPGETVPFKVTFDPAAHGPAGIGRIVRNVFVDSPNGDRLTLTISASVTP